MVELKHRLDVILYDLIEIPKCGVCNSDTKHEKAYRVWHISINDQDRIKEVLETIGK